MNSTVEIEKAIRDLPTAEARDVADWLRDYLAHETSDEAKAPSESAFDQWRGCGQLPAGKNTDDYLRLIRDGNGS